MGYLIATGPCGACAALFQFNPERVPSVVLSTGRKVPLCQSCVGVFNTIRAEKGMELIRPLEGAYAAQEV